MLIGECKLVLQPWICSIVGSLSRGLTLPTTVKYPLSRYALDFIVVMLSKRMTVLANNSRDVIVSVHISA